MRFAPWPARTAVPPASDAVLAGRAADGDAAALEAIYRRESGPVYRYALAMCGNPAWAADATQEAFLALVTQPRAYDATHGSLGAYLAGVARHVLLAQWRRQQRQVDGAGATQEDDDPAPADGDASEALSPEAVLVRHQTVDAVWHGLRRLPWAMREAVVLVDLQERSYQQAADVAGIDVNTLRTRLHRGRHRLAACLAEGARP
jgi:RNA polymerase sigma-70 factor, ECF subfamily